MYLARRGTSIAGRLTTLVTADEATHHDMGDNTAEADLLFEIIPRNSRYLVYQLQYQKVKKDMF